MEYRNIEEGQDLRGERHTPFHLVFNRIWKSRKVLGFEGLSGIPHFILSSIEYRNLEKG